MANRKSHTVLQATFAGVGAFICLSTSANSEADTLARASMTVALQIQGTCSIATKSNPAVAPTVDCDFAEPYDMQWSGDPDADMTMAAERGHVASGATYWTVAF